MQTYAILVELEKCCQPHIFLQNIVLIQSRTIPPQICELLQEFFGTEFFDTVPCPLWPGTCLLTRCCSSPRRSPAAGLLASSVFAARTRPLAAAGWRQIATSSFCRGPSEVFLSPRKRAQAPSTHLRGRESARCGAQTGAPPGVRAAFVGACVQWRRNFKGS